MANNGRNMGLKSYDDLFKTDVGRKTEEIIPMQLSELKPFSEQPFKVLDNEDMDELVESIKIKLVHVSSNNKNTRIDALQLKVGE